MPTFSIPYGRRSKRNPTKGRAILFVGPKGEKKEHPCQLVETSQGGMRLTTDVELRPGDAVDVMPTEGSWYSTRCRVVWARGSEQDWEAGLQVLNPFSK